jgi:hypothetical protein
MSDFLQDLKAYQTRMKAHGTSLGKMDQAIVEIERLEEIIVTTRKAVHRWRGKSGSLYVASCLAELDKILAGGEDHE